MLVSKGKVMREQDNGIALTMPKLEGRTGALIDAYNLKYSGAMQGQRLSILDRSQVHHGLRVLDSELDKAGRVMGVMPENPACTNREKTSEVTG